MSILKSKNKKSSDPQKYKCHCGAIFEGKPSFCPNCNVKFGWDKNDSKNIDFENDIGANSKPGLHKKEFKCKRCGKRGLFLKLNSNSLCNECENAFMVEEEKRRQEEEKKCQIECSESIFLKITNIYSDLCKKRDYRSFSIDDSIKYVDLCVAICSSLSELINEYVSSPGFFDSLCVHKVEGFSYFVKEIKELNFSIFDDDTEDDIKKRLKEIPMNLISNFKKDKNRLLLDKKFLEESQSIGHHSITLKNNAPLRLDVSNLYQIKYSSVTSKTNYERLGNFVSIDIETTGLSHVDNKITEVSAIKFEYWQPVSIFTTLINPETYIPANITKLTGITNEMVSNSPIFSDIIFDLISFIGSNNIVGHNLEFDLKFLYFNGLDVLSCKRKYYDTLQIAKRTLKSFNNKNPDKYYDVDDYKLTTLCEYYKIRGNLYAHRAESDCLTTGYLFKNLAYDKIS